jgi:hypothetical protein
VQFRPVGLARARSAATELPFHWWQRAD